MQIRYHTNSQNIWDYPNILGKEKIMNDRLLQYERILFKNTLLDIVRPSQFNEPTAKDFRNLKPIRGVYGAYDYHSLKLEIGKESHTLKWDWNNESEEVKELSRQKAFDETNNKIIEYNKTLDESVAPMRLFKKWLLQGYFVSPTIGDMNPNIRDNPLSTFLFDSEFIYKKVSITQT